MSESKHPVTILGAGKIGRGIARILHLSGRYEVYVADISAEALESLKDETPVATGVLDVNNHADMVAALKAHGSAISALPFDQNVKVAKAALEAGVSYFDLTEDVATTQAIRAIADEAAEGQIFMPQCGLAPGYIGILAHDLCNHFDRLDRVMLRVGALPLYPTNMLKYNLTWSIDGLINEYCNPCEAIYSGEPCDLQPLEGLESFALDGVDYEAFNTSGGLGTLCETLAGKVNTLDYKTVRYAGHRDLMMFLLHGLRMIDRRELLKELMEEAIPCTHRDVVLIFSTVTGWRKNRFEQVSCVRKVYHGEVHGLDSSSIQITTASSACVVVDLHFDGKLPSKGFVRQEDVKLSDFESNEFGQPYVKATAVKTPATPHAASHPMGA